MAAAAPTGCFKCGRPGHWSRDCPSAPSSSPPNSNPNPNPRSKFSSSSASKFSNAPPAEKPAAAPKKAPQTRPKLTADLLLSDDGLGYVLRHFPRSFKYHGRGHEVERVGATRRVRRCISELRERVARGGDPTKLHEPPVEEVAPDCEQEVRDMGDQNVDFPDRPLESNGADEIQEEMFAEIYQKATEEPPRSLQDQPREVPQDKAASEASPARSSGDGTPNQVEACVLAGGPCKVQLTEEQKAHIEANRQKALERAAARARSSQAS